MKLKIFIKASSNENLYGLLANLDYLKFNLYSLKLPSNKRRWAILRSAHVNSKSRLHYECSFSKYCLELKSSSFNAYKLCRILGSLRKHLSTNMVVQVKITS